MAKLPDSVKDRIFELGTLGWELKRIAREVKRPVSTVRYQLTKAGLLSSLVEPVDPVDPGLPSGQPESSDQPTPDHPDDQADVGNEPPVDTTPERSQRGRGVLWNILHDPSSPPQARVQAFNTLAESERWGLDDDMQRRLPPPLSRADLIDRQGVLLRSLSPPILAEVLRGLSAWCRANQPSIRLTVEFDD